MRDRKNKILVKKTKMCLLRRMKKIYCPIRRTQNQYDASFRESPDCAFVCSRHALMVWGIKPNEKPHFLTGCVVKSQ
jgi:hypothetical protein